MRIFRILVIALPIIYGIYFCYFKKEDQILWPQESITIKGIIDDYPEKRISSNRYRIKISELNGIKVTDKSKILIITNPYTEYSYGNKVEITGAIENPKDFITDTGKTFDYDNYLKLSKIYGIAKDPRIKILEEFNGNRIKKFLFKIRENFSNNLNKNLNTNTSTLARGVLLGERTSIDNNLRDNLARTSTSHIIALSGYNITIVSEILMKVLNNFSIVIKSTIGILGIFLFIALAGGGSSAVRAGIMATVLIYARSRGFTYNALWALVIATNILIIINPLALRHDMGFHLSVLATFGLICFQAPINVWLIKHKINKFVSETISTTLAASIMSFPYIAYNMGIISILGIFVNTVVVPLIPPLMLFSFLTGITTGNFEFLAKIFGFITEKISEIILLTINKIGDIPHVAILVQNINLVFILIIYLFLFYIGLTRFAKNSS